eukprot:m.275341 g.275341  ORF g.275341 m.275341 type:complete len:139 (+) comp40597_c0_seq58:3927-4343(+)
MRGRHRSDTFRRRFAASDRSEIDVGAAVQFVESGSLSLDEDKPVQADHVIAIQREVATVDGDVITFGIKLLGKGVAQVQVINSDNPQKRIDLKFASICYKWMSDECNDATIKKLLAALKHIDMDKKARQILSKMPHLK